MKKFFFTGDVRHPGRVFVLANTEDEALKKLEDYEFEVYDEEDKNLAFDSNGEDPEVEDVDEAEV